MELETHDEATDATKHKIMLPLSLQQSKRATQGNPKITKGRDIDNRNRFWP